MQPRRFELPAADGLRLRGLDWGGHGRPCLLLHGLACDATCWLDFAPYVARHLRVLALDLRGHGESDRDPEGRYELDHLVADLDAAIDALDLRDVALVGHSLGGQVVISYASGRRGRVRGCVLVDAGPRAEREGLRRFVEDTRAAPTCFDSGSDYARHLSRTYPLAAPAALHRMVRSGLRQLPDGRYEVKTDPRCVARWIEQRDRPGGPGEPHEERQWGELERVVCPTLVVRGGVSAVLGREAAMQMVDILPDARLAEVPGAGHSVMLDNPQGFLQVAARFLRSLPAARGAPDPRGVQRRAPQAGDVP